jgi:hypothetical protein
MAKATKFVSVSQQDIEDHIIHYFATRFQTDPNTITATTNLKQRFNFNDAAWAGLAETFSAMDWMKKLHVRLAQSQMGSVATVAELTALIWKNVAKLVAGIADAATPLASTRKTTKPKPATGKGR